MNNKILDAFSKNRRTYKKVFLTPEGEEVMKDLARFCNQMSPSYVAGDSHGTAYREGMRRVFLRISNYVNLDETDIQKMYYQKKER